MRGSICGSWYRSRPGLRALRWLVARASFIRINLPHRASSNIGKITEVLSRLGGGGCRGEIRSRHADICLDNPGIGQHLRHARKRGLSDPCQIYQRGAEKLDDILDWCAELHIPAVTLWVFSTENLKRSQAEVYGILSAIEAKVAALAHDPFMHQKRIRIQAIGRLDLLPESVVAAIRAAETATAQYNLMTLTIAVGYGGREEIADAVRGFVKMQARQGASLSDVIERITPETIACHLYAADLPDPDLIIRTSGEIRLSGFLLWQSVHSEFYFTDVLWPAFRKVDFLRAIRAYQARNRRFGR